ncbi:hypothetical protein G6031_01905 [Dietzia sp. CQ4]|uniref:DUF3846 domain-containing protein n=1 Tax=Dietzia sp. (strain CQ4) TaxID=370437 RepID=UPI0015FAC127|nr:hypothetical protein [Dietzia sp. CQ4]MBB1033147.1 hypothetical protein [Dietzia sp. CQ4]
MPSFSTVNAVLIDIDGTVTDEPVEVQDGSTLAGMYRVVRCSYVERIAVMDVPNADSLSVDAWVDEEGIYNSVPNVVAQVVLKAMSGIGRGPVFGRVLLLGGDETSGETVSLPGGVIELVRELARLARSNPRVRQACEAAVARGVELGRL